jgi:hypothetical protein
MHEVQEEGEEEMNCLKCKHYLEGYCKKIRHIIENGAAMEWHGKRCGE